ncbi:uncharacterized protein AMSG_09532 [Thecamonas trahens ATCC 50062]|uniref:Transmembrane protein 170A n=1 Tax=Thecamonas trahens ATCC 50062 TaxID=461836 RepID=A0A0L0DNH2_THETB|nr:hypothetical protein AMSG_09532 [Thecamonas trahens ATCC 50062]KNC53810.1 hypothetical protein AMSG_09532 [Thecamonas trahens ATCC 50062]|eukprot:XP_013754368.1 hypothetical protein AMSG_09532 [Thecamonas trahens ATCC 50062]
MLDDIFSRTLVSFTDIWVHVMVWVLVVCTTIYFMAGCVALYTFREHLSALLFPFGFAIVGAFTGLALGSLFGVVLSASYTSGEFPMPGWSAAIWGTATAAVYLFMSWGRIMAIQ